MTRGLYTIAAGAVALALILRSASTIHATTGAAVVLAALVVAHGRRWRRQVQVTVAVAPLVVAAAAVAQASGWGGAGILILAAGMVGLACVASLREQVLVGFVTLGLPCACILIDALAPGDTAVPRLALAWSLAAWPIAALVLRGSSWTIAAIAGPALFLLLVQSILIRSFGARLDLLDLLSWSDLGFANWILGAQALLSLAMVLPALGGSSEGWRLSLVAGVFIALGSWVLARLAGPWPDGMPSGVPVLMLLGGGLACVGLAGILATARKADPLADAGAKSSALGLGIAVAMSITAVESPGDDDAIVQALTAASASILVGWVLAAGLLGAAALARRRLVRETVLASQHWALLEPRPLLPGLCSCGRRLLAGVGESMSPLGARPNWVALCLLPAVALVLPQLGRSGAIALLMTLAMILLRGLVSLALPLWILALAGSRALTTQSLGAGGLLAWGSAAIALVAAWPLLRFTRLGPVWALPVSLCLTVMAGLRFGQFPDPLSTGMAVLAAMLVANALTSDEQRGRSGLLALGLGLASVLLVWQIPRLDPCAIILAQEFRTWQDAGLILMNAALPALVLMDRTRWEQGLEDRLRHCLRPLAILIPLAMAALWSSGIRLGVGTGPASWAMLLVAATCLLAAPPPGIGAVAGSQAPRSARWPLLPSAAALLAAALLGTIGQVLAQQASLAGSVQDRLHAGALTGIAISAIRDSCSVVCALLLVAWLRWTAGRNSTWRARLSIATSRFLRRKQGDPSRTPTTIVSVPRAVAIS